jgi:hypothetical protein
MEKKLQIIETPDYTLAVSDEEIKESNWYENNGVLFISDNIFDEGNNPNQNKNNRLVIAYKPKANARELDLPLLPEIDVKDDVEKLAEEYVIDESYLPVYKEECKRAYINGYKAATKVYSEEDLRKAIDFGIRYTDERMTTDIVSEIFDIDCSGNLEETTQLFTQSLKQLKTPKWFVAETTGGGEYLAGTVGGNEIWAEYPIALKTTTINGKTYLIGKYI